MRSPRVVYGVVAAILAVAGFVLPRYLADRSAPELGETVVVPAGASGNAPTPPTPSTPAIGTTEPGAVRVTPAPVRTAGDDDDSDDGIEDPGDANDPDDDD
ncbi:hypothetical protein [Kribbella sp. CA-294648]|uniref:hypothetical protein n=1 Tax=Kribbella sp. CA-294648 TaxID=3239948 RepID=UPI003D943113